MAHSCVPKQGVKVLTANQRSVSPFQIHLSSHLSVAYLYQLTTSVIIQVKERDGNTHNN